LTYVKGHARLIGGGRRMDHIDLTPHLDRFFEEAKKKFPGLTRNEFNEAGLNVVEGLDISGTTMTIEKMGRSILNTLRIQREGIGK